MSSVDLSAVNPHWDSLASLCVSSLSIRFGSSRVSAVRFVTSVTSPKRIDREGLRESRSGTWQDLQMFHFLSI